MPSEAEDESAETAFQNLSSFLSNAFKEDGIVSLTSEIIEPFRSLTTLQNSRLLRPLAKFFESKTGDQLLRLAPRAFYNVFVIVLQFPYSRNQERLLLHLQSVIALYKDANATALKLAKFTGEKIKANSIIRGRQFICRKLTYHAFEILDHPSVHRKKKYIAAQLLLRILTADSDTVSVFLEDKHIDCIRNTIYNGLDHVSRILIADVIRELNKQEQPDIQTKLEDRLGSFSEADLYNAEANSGWINQCVTFLSNLDADHKVNGSGDRVFKLRSLEFEDGSYQDENGNILVILSENLTFVLPAQKNDSLSLIEVPFLPGMGVEPYECDSSETSTATPNCIKITFITGNGDRYFRGTRKAINDLYIEVTKPKDVAEIVHLISNYSTNATENTSDELSTEDFSPNPMGYRQSLAFISMDWTSDDDLWVQQARRAPDKDTTKIAHDGPVGNSSVQDSPSITKKIIERESSAAQSIFSSRSITGKTTELYGRMRSSQQTETKDRRLSIETPQISDTDDYINVPNSTGIDSPTFKLSQMVDNPFTNDVDTCSNVAIGIENNSTAQDVPQSSTAPRETLLMSNKPYAGNLTSAKITKLKADCGTGVPTETNNLNPGTSICKSNSNQARIERSPSPVGSKKPAAESGHTQVSQSGYHGELHKGHKLTRSRGTRKTVNANKNVDLQVEIDEDAAQGIHSTINGSNIPSTETKKHALDAANKHHNEKVRALQAKVVKKMNAELTLASTRARRGHDAKSIEFTRVNPRAPEVGEDIWNASGTRLKTTAQPHVRSDAKATRRSVDATTGHNTENCHPTQGVEKSLVPRTSDILLLPVSLATPQTNSYPQQLELDSEPDDAMEDQKRGPGNPDSLGSVQTASRTTSDTTFAAKLSQMIAKTAASNGHFLPPKTPFGNRKRFVADVNAARSTSPPKLPKKKREKNIPTSDTRVCNLLSSSTPNPPSTHLNWVRDKDDICLSASQSYRSPQQPGSLTRVDSELDLVAREAETVTDNGTVVSTHDRDRYDHNTEDRERGLSTMHTERNLQQCQVFVHDDSILPDSQMDQTTAERSNETAEDVNTIADKQHFQPLVSELLIANSTAPNHDQSSCETSVNDSNSQHPPEMGIEPQRIPDPALNAGLDTTNLGRVEKREMHFPKPQVTQILNGSLAKPDIENSHMRKSLQGENRVVQASIRAIAAKPNVVHFARSGPVNQGVQPEQTVTEGKEDRFANERGGSNVDVSHQLQDDQEFPMSDHGEGTNGLPSTENHVEEKRQRHLPFEQKYSESLPCPVLNSPSMPAPAINEGQTVLEQESSQRIKSVLSKAQIDLTQLSDEEHVSSSPDCDDSEDGEHGTTTAISVPRSQQALHSAMKSTPTAIHVNVTANDLGNSKSTSVMVHRSISATTEPEKHGNSFCDAFKGKLIQNISSPQRISTLVAKSAGGFANANVMKTSAETSRKRTTTKSRMAMPVNKSMATNAPIKSTKFDPMSMPPPPRPPPLRIIMPASSDSAHASVADVQPNISISALNDTKRIADIHDLSLPLPKRCRLSTSILEANQTSPRTGTPAPFSATICEGLEEITKESEAAKCERNQYSVLLDAQVNGFLDKKDTNKRRSLIVDRRPETPGLTEDTTPSEPELEGTPASDFRDLPSIRNVLESLSNKIIGRFVGEENVARSQLLVFHDQINAVHSKIRNTWDAKINYEAQRLLGRMREEENQLQNALVGIVSSNEKLSNEEPAQDTVQKIAEGRAELLNRLRAIG